ncbi:ferritin-like domain-containing protein [Chitinophaga costaii]|nr:ferritin-like domain-containing protein [Chitinophaga costaii]
MNFFQDEIKDIYWAEKHIVKTLPKLKKAATSPQLKTAFDQHTTQSQEHVNRLDKVFQHLGKKAQAKKCEAMNGIIQEGEEIISHTEAGTATRDVGLILAAQKVEHYEIATYGGLAQLARTLQLKHIAALLETTLREEKETDTILSTIAEQHVNYDALHESEAPQAAGGNEDEDEEETDIEIEFDEVDIDVADDEANEDFDDMEEDLDDEER